MSFQRWTARNLELQKILINEAERTTRTCAEVQTVFQLLDTWSSFKGLQKQNLQWTQLWTTTQQASAQRLLKEGGYNSCLRCYNSSGNKPERAGNVWYRILNPNRGQVNRIYTAAASPKSVFVSSRNPRITRSQDGNSADSCFSAREVSTIGDSAILCSQETEVGWPDCRSARVERSLPLSEELAKSELQSKRSSSNSWTRLLRHPSPIRIQEIRRQNCTMGSEIENRMGLKWSPTREASSNPCYNSNLSIRW